MAHIFGSVWDRFNRNALNNISRSVEQQGKSIQDLVAEGQLTPAQYAELIKEVNDLISKGEVSVSDINPNLGKIDQTLLSTELLEQIAGTAPVLSEVADRSVTTSKIAKKAVTPESTDFFNISDNKFDKDAVLDGKSVDLDGSIINDASRWLSDYIELPSSGKISVTSGVFRLGYYDEKKSWISRSGISSGTLIDASANPNIRFIRLSGSMDKNDVMVNNGTVLHDYVPYFKVLEKEYAPNIDFEEIENISVHPSQEIHFRASKNLYNRFDLEKGKSLDSAGNIINDSNRYLSKPILLDRSKTISFKYDDGFRYGIYDESGNVISRSGKIENQNLKIDLTELKSVHYMLVSPVELVKDNIMINYGESSLPYEDYGFTLVSTPEIPIRIDDAIVPEGSGNGGDGGGSEPTFSLAGTSQIFESVNGVYSPNVLTDVYSTANTAQVDYIELSSNTLMAEIIVTYIDSTGTEKPYQIINTVDFTTLSQTIGNIVEYGGVNVEFLQYDEGTSQYKIAIKTLNFSDGFKVQIRNTDTVDKSIAVQLAGRYYV